MLTKPILLDETGQKILSAIQRLKNKLLGTVTPAITPGSAANSGTEPMMQDDTGRDIIGALNDLGDTMPAIASCVDVKGAGDGMAIGKSAADNRLDSAWPIYADGGIHALKTLYADYENAGIDRANAIALTTTTASGKFSRTSLLQFSVDSSTGAMLDKYEQYRFPEVTQDMMANAPYDILTSKNTKITYSTIANGGTTRYTIAPSSRHFVLIIGSGVANNYGIFLFACNSSSAASQRQIAKGSGVTVSTSGTTITMTSSGAACTVMDWALMGENLTVQS